MQSAVNQIILHAMQSCNMTCTSLEMVTKNSDVLMETNLPEAEPVKATVVEKQLQ